MTLALDFGSSVVDDVERERGRCKTQQLLVTDLVATSSGIKCVVYNITFNGQ